MWYGLGEGQEPRPLSLSLCDSNEQPLISNITAYVRDKLRAGEPGRRLEVCGARTVVGQCDQAVELLGPDFAI